MKNRLTFANVAGALLENKKKTYQQYHLIADMFSLCLSADRDGMDADRVADENALYSRWCSGARPIPMEIIRTYEDGDRWDVMEKDFRERIIPNLINVPQARSVTEDLIRDSADTIGDPMAASLVSEKDDAAFFTSAVRYAVLSSHSDGSLYSPDLSDILQGARLPSCTPHFVGRKQELKLVSSALDKDGHVFLTGLAGIGKSELAKAYAHGSSKKYTNIIHIHYSGDLRRDIARLPFADDRADEGEDALLERHYKTIKRLRGDSLLVIDNFNVLPSEDAFLLELLKNDARVIVTTRCRIRDFRQVEVKELDREEELPTLFYKHCPSAKNDPGSTLSIINELKGHTLAVCMAALTLDACGMDAEELLHELRESGIGHNNNEIEVYKDEEFAYATMMGHLKKLLELNRLDEGQTDTLRTLSLLPPSGIPKKVFARWTGADNLNTVNGLVRHGLICEDTENLTVALHPLVQEVALAETEPTVSKCRALIEGLHKICLARGVDVRRPSGVMDCLQSINRNIIIDEAEYYLLFLQDMFPYFEKYQALDVLPDILERIRFLMDQVEPSVCDRALFLCYKSYLLFLDRDYAHAIKNYRKAILQVENLHRAEEATGRSANLLSNLHSNLSLCYLFQGEHVDAAKELKEALSIMKEYSHLNEMGRNDFIQQTLNLADQLMALHDLKGAMDILDFCEGLIAENIGTDNLDYGLCQCYRGIVSYKQMRFTDAEKFLLSADGIFDQLLEGSPGNGYLRTTRHYLYSTYMRLNKPELAEKYKQLLRITKK